MNSTQTNTTMHPNEVPTSVALVKRLIRSQFPEWAALPVQAVPSAGTDNALYRLGEGMVMRLPRIPSAALKIEKEQRWLPQLAPQLPLDIPTLIAKGMPGEGFPWHWSIYLWLQGQNKAVEDLTQPQAAAVDLAKFILALQQIAPSDGPPPGEHNSARGVPLAERDAATRSAIRALAGRINVIAAAQAWERTLDAPAWEGKPVWIHGDLLAGNLLFQQDRLTAVIDFGTLGVGDPACDVMAAWLFLSRETRGIFRSLLNVDDATWLRGSGWALSMGLGALPYYEKTNPVLAGVGERAINEVLMDLGFA